MGLCRTAHTCARVQAHMQAHMHTPGHSCTRRGGGEKLGNKVRGAALEGRPVPRPSAYALRVTLAP